MSEKQSYRDADDMPTERAVLEREWKAMRLALSMPRAAVEAAQPEAVGWKLVPIEPTEEMLHAGWDFAGSRNNAAATFSAMLAATPTESQSAEADERSEREAFEAWVISEPGELSTKRHSDGGYLWSTTHELWRAWKAARALSTPTAPAQAEPKLTHIHRADPEAAAKAHRDATPPATAAGPSDAERPMKSLNALIADQLRPFLKPGDKVIWREAFRWHDDNGVMPNHYDGISVTGLADEFGYQFDWDFNMNHAAIVRATKGGKL